ncbi:kyphoscoliosis peptidase-like [Tiliqua scincoides]|uniref:kyphoscoliosis peptidase-like n=1 Tax=Tiliqua scincoides TaxID=71010 RepID=UPI003461E9AE
MGSKMADVLQCQYEEFFFLTHPAILINSHFPEDRKWQLLKLTLSEQEFGCDERLSPPFFSQQLVAASPATSDVKTARAPDSILDKLFAFFY